MSAPHPRDLALVTVSIDLGAGRRGVDMGPSALRIAGITTELESLNYRVREAGTVTAGGFETTDQGDNRLRFHAEILDVVGRTRVLVRDALGGGCLPLILGGDHSLSIGSVAGVAEHYREQDGGSIGVIWVDAHTDMNRPETSPSGNIHGMSLAVLMGLGDPALVRATGSERVVNPENVSVLGARQIDPGERDLVAELGVRVFTMSEIDERGVSVCMDEALERANDGTRGFHMSFDLDALDPSVAPGVGTPIAGGLTYREGHLVCEKAARSGRLVSLELVELNPVLDSMNQTALQGVGLLSSALGKRIL